MKDLKRDSFRTWSSVFDAVWKAHKTWRCYIACVCIPKNAEIKPQNVEILQLDRGMAFADYSIIYSLDSERLGERPKKWLLQEEFQSVVNDAKEYKLTQRERYEQDERKWQRIFDSKYE